MIIRNGLKLSTLAVLLAGNAALVAQVTTGALAGHVTDNAGRPIAGVRVSLESPALFHPRVLKTDAKGEYRGQLLPVGTYTVKVSADGWLGKTATGVRVGLGSNLSLDFSLTLLKETGAVVEVVATAQEAKTADKVSVNYSAEELLKLPTNRSFDGALALAPGVTGSGLGTSIRGGSFGGQTKAGGGYSQVMYRIDGIDVKDDTGTQWDGPARAQLYEPLPDSIEDVQVVLSALNARHGRSQGGQVNVVTKTGSNTFEGSIRTTFSRPSWTTDLPHGPVAGSDYAASESNAVESYSRFTDITFSGPIIKDRLWFYVGTRVQPSQSGTATLGWNGVPVQKNASGGWDVIPGATLSSVMKYPMVTWGAFPKVDNVLKGVGTPYPTGYGNFDISKYTDWNSVVPADTTYHKYEGKLTFLVNDNNTLALTYLTDKTVQGGYTGERTSPPNTALDKDFVGDLTTETKAWTLGWNSTINEHWFLEMRAFKAEVKLNDVTGPTQYPIFVQSQLSTGDPNIQILSTDNQGMASGNGQAGYFGSFYNRRSSSDITPNIRGNQSLNFNVKTFQEAAGQHEIDFGAEYFQTKHQFGRERSGNRGVFEGGFIYNPDTKDYLYPTFYANSASLVPLDSNGQADQALVQYGELPMRGPGAYMERYWAGQSAAKNNSTGLWLNDTWTLDSNWNLMLGLRYNRFAIRDTSERSLADINVTEPRLQLKWNPDGKGQEIYTFTAAKLASAYSDEMAAWFRTNGWTTRTVHAWKGLPGQLAVDDNNIDSDPLSGVRWVDYNTLIDPANYGAPSAIIDLSQTAKTAGLQVPYAIEFSLGYMRNFDTGSVRLNFVQRTYKKEWLSFVHDGYYDPADPTKYLTLVQDPSGLGAPQWQQTHRFLNSGLEQIYRGVELAWNEAITSRLNFGGNYTWSQITGRNALDYYNYRDEKLRNGLSEDVFAPEGVLSRSQVLHAFLTYVVPIGKGNVSASTLATYSTSGVRTPNGVGVLKVADVDTGNAAFHGYSVQPIDNVAGQNILLNYNTYSSPMGAFTRGTDIYTVDVKLQAQMPLAGKVMLTTYVQIKNIFNHLQRISVYDWSGSSNGTAEFGTGGSVGNSSPITGRPLGGFSQAWGTGNDNTYYSGGRTFTEFSVGLKF